MGYASHLKNGLHLSEYTEIKAARRQTPFGRLLCAVIPPSATPPERLHTPVMPPSQEKKVKECLMCLDQTSPAFSWYSRRKSKWLVFCPVPIRRTSVEHTLQLHDQYLPS